MQSCRKASAVPNGATKADRRAADQADVENGGEADGQSAAAAAGDKWEGLVVYYLSLQERADEEGQGVRPGDRRERVPPALHHHRNIEAQHEGNRYEVGEVAAVHAHVLEEPGGAGKVTRQAKIGAHQGQVFTQIAERYLLNCEVAGASPVEIGSTLGARSTCIRYEPCAFATNCTLRSYPHS